MCVFTSDAQLWALGLKRKKKPNQGRAYLRPRHWGMIFNSFGTDVTDMNVRIMSN